MPYSVQVTKLNAGDGIGSVSQNAWKQEDKTDHNKDNKRKYLCQMSLSATERSSQLRTVASAWRDSTSDTK